MIGIYKITNPKGRVYVGQSTNIEKRFTTYNTLSASKNQTILHNSLKKYGVSKHKFEVLTTCTIDELNDLERYFQELYSACGTKGLNCRYVESNDRMGLLSEQTKNKIRAKAIGRKVSEETKLKLSEFGKRLFKENPHSIKRIARPIGVPLSVQHRANISKSLTGRKMNPESTKKTVETRKLRGNNKHTEEAKAKIKAKRATQIIPKGRKMPEDHKEKLRKINTGKPSKFKGQKRWTEEDKKKYNFASDSKLVLNIQNGIYYESAKEASVNLPMNYCNFVKKLSGFLRNKTNYIYA